MNYNNRKYYKKKTNNNIKNQKNKNKFCKMKRKVNKILAKIIVKSQKKIYMMILN